MIAGQLEIQLMANMARLAQDMDQAKKTVGGAMASIEKAVGFAKNALVGLGAIGLAAALANQVKQVIDLADSLNKLSQKTGLATETLSQMQYAAKLADVSNETLNGSIRKLNISVAQGIAGDKEKLALFKSLGITQKDLAKGTESVMMQIADAYSKAADGAGKVAVGNGLMGKTADEMIPFLNGGSEAIRALMKEADKLGLTIGTDFAKQAEEFNDNLTRIQTSSQKLTVALAGDLVSALGSTVKAMADAAIEGGKFAALIAGIQTLITGDDRHKANVKIVENTEMLWAAENALAKARARNNAEEVARLTNRVRIIKEDLALHRNYAKVLDDEKAKAEAAAAALDTAKKNAPQIKAPQSAHVESEYEKINKDLAKRADLLKEELALGEPLKESQKFQIELLARLTAAHDKLSKSEAAALKARGVAIGADMELIEKRNKLLKIARAEEEAAEEFRKEVSDSYAADSKTREQFGLAVTAQAKALSDSNEELEAEKRLLGATQRERAIALEHLKIRLQYERELDALNSNTAFDQKQREIERRRMEENRARAEEIAVQRANLEEHNRIWESIDQTAHDVFVNIFEGGQSAFKKLGNVLKASLLDWLYQMTVKKWIFNIGASITGGLAGGAANATGSALGGVGGAVSGISALGGTFGMGMNAGFSALFGEAGFSGAMSAGTTALGAGNIAGGLGTLAGALGPIIAGVALLSSIIGSTKGETRAGGQYGYGFNGSGTSNRRGTSYGGVNGAFFLEGPSGGDPYQAQATAAINSTVTGINNLFSSLGSSSQIVNFNAGYESSGKDRGGVFSGGALNTGALFGESGKGDNYAGTLFESTSTQSPDAATAIANFSSDLLQVTVQALQAATDIPQTIKDMVDGLDAEALGDDALKALLTNIDSVIAGANGLRQAASLLPFEKLAALSFDAAAGLVKLAGGLDTLMSNLGTYYENFYSESERQAQVTKNVTNTLGSLGIAMPKTRDEFRALVSMFEGDLSESGQKAYATLLSVAGAFAQITPVAEEAVSVVESLADAADAAFSVLERSVEAARSVAQETVSDLSRIFSMLGSAVRDLYGQVDSTASMGAQRGAAFITQALAIARASGYLPDGDDLAQAISSARGGVVNGRKSQLDVDFDRLKLAGELQALQDIAEPQLTAAEQQLQYLDDILESARNQLDALKGIDTSVVSVSEALDRFYKALYPDSKKAGGNGPGASKGGAVFGGGGSGGMSAAPAKYNALRYLGTSGTGLEPVVDPELIAHLDKISPLYHSFDGTGNLVGLLTAIQAAGGTMRDLSILSGFYESDWAKAGESVGIPAFEKGTDYVPNDGPAYLHQGERITPAAYNRSDATNAELLLEMKGMRKELAEAKAENKRLADGMDRFTNGWSVGKVEVVPA